MNYFSELIKISRQYEPKKEISQLLQEAQNVTGSRRSFILNKNGAVVALHGDDVKKISKNAEATLGEKNDDWLALGKHASAVCGSK